EQEAQESREDGAARGDDRLERAAQGRARRGPAVGLRAELLAEARDVEESVVGGRADDEDEEDALRLPREEDDALLGEQPHGRERGAQREDARREDEERQDGGAVDDDEDDEDRGERDAEEEAVDAGERVAEVRGEAGGSGDEDLDAVGRLGG